MATEHVTVTIHRTADAVYAYASDPRHLTVWAAGLTAAPLDLVDGRWVTDSPMGRVTIDFAPHNEYGILDHDVTTPDGQTVYNPFRVITDGDRCEVVFSVRQRDLTDDEFARDIAAVRADLETLRDLLEAAE